MKSPVNSIKEKVTQYLQLRYEMFRLEFIERSSNVMGYFAFIILSFFLVFIIIFFVGLGLAEWLSNLFDSRAGGYFATAGIFLIIMILFLVLGKNVIRMFADKMVGMLSKSRKDDNSEED